jgi:hypothetical protein
MPGKYPTRIVASPKNTNTTIVAGTPLPLSDARSNTATLRMMFPNSPLYATGETEDTVRAAAKTYLQPTLQAGDSAHFPGGVNLDYQGPVNADGTVNSDTAAPTFGGLTDTEYEGRYLPFLITPTDPAAGEDGASTGVARAANDNFGSGSPVTSVLPEEMSALIAATSIEASGQIAPLGQSGTGTASTSTTTHLKNDGAYTPPS